MANLEKLLKALEMVKLSQSGSEKSKNLIHESVTIKEEEPKSLMESASAMVNLASTLTQQGQGLLSKKDQALSSRDKASMCSSIVETVVGGSKTLQEGQKLLSTGMETLFLLLDDPDPDVRMNADEALNRIIRSLSETYMAKIQFELFKVIKKNGSVRSLRGTLTRFGILCHHIRPQKCRAYIQNLLPHLIRLASRPEELLQETLAQCVEKVMSTLGQFTNDTEVKSLLRVFLPNLTSPSPSLRRSSANILVSVCVHSRKFKLSLMWLLETILSMLIPIQEVSSAGHILGCLLGLRLLCPHLPDLSQNPGQACPNSAGLPYTGSTEADVVNEQALQVYEICLHYAQSLDHNIVTASLECLQSLLQHPPSNLVSTLTNPEGLGVSRISRKARVKTLHSRAASQLSIAPSLVDDDLSVDLGEAQDTLKLDDMEDSDEHRRLEETANTEDVKYDDDDDTADEEGQQEEVHQTEEERGLYSAIEIGHLAGDVSVLFGRSPVDVDERSDVKMRRKKMPEHHSIEQCSFDDKGEVLDWTRGNIGHLLDEDCPLKYLSRYVCSSFLLSGRCHSLQPDKTVKVSIKVLAINCLGLAVSQMPSLMAEPLYIDSTNEDVEDIQHLHDVLRFHRHHDPQLSASVGLLAGQYIRASLVSCNGQYSDLAQPNLSLDSLLDLLCKLLNHDSSVTVRGALSGLALCLPEILHSWHSSTILHILPHIVKAASNPYWLVKVELCDMLSLLPFTFVDHTENYSISAQTSAVKSSMPFYRERFSHRVLTSVFIPLLGDQDQKVRSAASSTVVRLTSELLTEGDLVKNSSWKFLRNGYLNGQRGPYRIDQSWRLKKQPFCTPHPPFDQLIQGVHFWNGSKETDNSLRLSPEHQEWKTIENSLSRLVNIFSNHLLKQDNRYLLLGCMEVLCALSEKYPPVVFPEAWGCHMLPPNYSSTNPASHCGLVTMVLSLCQESHLAGDLSAQQYAVSIASNWVAGRAVYVLKEQLLPKGNADSTQPWTILGHPLFTSVGESLVQHLMRILCLYTGVLEEATPSVRMLFPSVGPGTTLSPLKRRSKLDSSSAKSRTQSSGQSDKIDAEDREKKLVKMGSQGCFSHLPHYVKLYDVVKSAYANYKMSLEDNVKEKLCALLHATLNGLGILMEVSAVAEFGRLAEELLQYLKATVTVLPTVTIFCGQQLLKCLFGSNVWATWSQLYPRESKGMLLSPRLPSPVPCNTWSVDECQPCLQFSGEDALYYSLFRFPLEQLKEDFKQDIGVKGGLTAASAGHSGASGYHSLRIQPKTSDKTSLGSYIRLFEPLVIKALKLYTISSDVLLQKAVLQLLIHLVQIRVNYCLLDSDQIFIGYVIKQLEYIEEGHLRKADELIPSMFMFLVLLSYERHHSKSIISVPKIIQLCDGLLASGHPPLSHCVLALKPLVEDLFLERCHSSAVDLKELETQREVLCSVLLRLIHYHQVLSLLSIVLLSTHDASMDKWRKLSRQVMDTLLPKMSKLQINLESKEALSATEDILNNVCPSVFRPPDLLLRSMLTSPSEIDTTNGVERWISGVLLLIRALVVHTSCDAICSCLSQLGLDMSFLQTQSVSSDRDVCHDQLSSSPLVTETGDPLSITVPPVLPEVAIARFVLEVLRVGAAELRLLRLAMLSSNPNGDSGLEEKDRNSSSFVAHLMYHLMLLLVHLCESKQWEPVLSGIKDIGSSQRNLTDEITSSLMSVANRDPSLMLLWCQILTALDLSTHTFWTKVLRTSQRKSITHIGNPTYGEVTGYSNCHSFEYLRRCCILAFADFVVQHMQEGEWLTWLVVQHISDVIFFHRETPILRLLRAIYDSSAASALLVQAIHARCDNIHKVEFGGQIISIASGVHPSQSGALVVFLIESMIGSPYLVVSRAASTLCAQRLHLMLASPSSPPQLSTEDTRKLLTGLQKYRLDNRYAQLYVLLQQVQHLNSSWEMTEDKDIPLDSEELPVSLHVQVDHNWYYQLVKFRCSKEGGGGQQECSQLLSLLEYADILSIMSSNTFNLSLLASMFTSGALGTLQASHSWGECSSSVDTGDSEEGSSGSGTGEAALYAVSKVVVIQHISKILSSVPKPHHVFMPGGGNKYSERLCKIFSSDQAFGRSLETLAAAVTAYMNSIKMLLLKPEVLPDAAEHIIQFALLSLEYLHWQLWLCDTSIKTTSSILAMGDAVFRNPIFADLLCQSNKTSLVCSAVAALHAACVYGIMPKGLPGLPSGLNHVLSGPESSVLLACKRLMQLVLWIEKEGHKELPLCLSQPLRGVLVSLSRVPTVNIRVRMPPELWNFGWQPEIAVETATSLPAIPVELLQETDILKQFIFRMELLGCTGKQQFEETWMALLSILNSIPNTETPPEEIPYINLSLSLAVRGITALLLQTLLVPRPGNPVCSSLLSVPRDKPLEYLNTKAGYKLQHVLQKLNNKLSEVSHLVHCGAMHSSAYSLGQLSVEYLSCALKDNGQQSASEHIDSLGGIACNEYEMRERQLASAGIDVQSCLHFLHYLYSSWLRPQSGICSSVLAEVAKSVCVLCDLFMSSSHHLWVLETFVPFYTTHPVEDHITSQYIILATCKALATLRHAEKHVSSSLSDGVLHIMESGLQHGQVCVRTFSLHGLLYLLQNPQEENSPYVTLAVNYILKHNDGKVSGSESHESAMWELWIYLVEHYDSLPDPTLPLNALHMALSTAATSTTSPKILHQVLKGVQRLVLIQQLNSGTVEVVLKLAMDLILNSSPSAAVASLPLFITALYADRRGSLANPSTENECSDPEILLQFMEKLTVLFDKIRMGYPYEAEIVASVLGTCLLDILPASQILNKVITEYISSHQPHPHLLGATLFQVFERAMEEGGERLVQEWVLLSLSNFTQRTPTSMAVWCLTCFFIAASGNKWLRAVFPSVQSRVGKLDSRDVQMFCVAASHFRQSLSAGDQKDKFDEVFQAVAVKGSPFDQLLKCLATHK